MSEFKDRTMQMAFTVNAQEESEKWRRYFDKDLRQKFGKKRVGFNKLLEYMQIAFISGHNIASYRRMSMWDWARYGELAEQQGEAPTKNT